MKSFLIAIMLLGTVLLPSSSLLAAPAGPTTGSGGNTTGTTGSGGNTAPEKTFKITNPLKAESIGGLVQAFIEIATYLLILFAVLMLLWVGLQYIMARGNPERMKELSHKLVLVIIGVAIVIGARVIIQIVINTLQASGTVSPGVIDSANDALRGK